MPQPAGVKTLGDVITWVTEQFGDIASVQIDAAKVTRWANTAILEIVAKNPAAFQGKSTQAGVIDQQEYDYPAGLISVSMLKYGDTVLAGVSFEKLQDILGTSFTTQKGDPSYWTHWANKFQLWPIPSTVKTITIYHTAKPAELTSAAEVLPLPDKFFPRICDYVLSKAQELDEDYSAAAASRQVFEDKLKEGLNSEDAMTGMYHVMDDPDFHSYDTIPYGWNY